MAGLSSFSMIDALQWDPERPLAAGGLNVLYLMSNYDPAGYEIGVNKFWNAFNWLG